LALAREHPGHWREVLCFAARQAGPERGSLSAHNLVHNQSFAEWRKHHQPTETDWRCAAVAARQLLEIGLVPLRSTEATQLRLAHVVEWLGAVLEQNGLVSVRERLEVSLDLSKLGDTREGVGLRKDGLPDICLEPALPAGKFALAETGGEREIEHPYRISRYPVTVAQFQAFVEQRGYEDDGSAGATQRLSRWWGRGLAWKRVNNIACPEDYEPVFQTPNHPRVGVNWYEAAAFCAWLTECLQERGQLQHGAVIRLPREAEWEQAARWSEKEKKADDRYSPWGGGRWDAPQRCNIRETQIGHTSAVGLFPSGNAGCGAADMAGNVWEWCENWYDEKIKSSRVSRGMSWESVEELSCSFRLACDPAYRFNFVGFRVVCVSACAQ